MDFLTRARTMAAFCRQRARMEHEDETFWLKEAAIWQKRAQAKVIKMPERGAPKSGGKTPKNRQRRS